MSFDALSTRFPNVVVEQEDDLKLTVPSKEWYGIATYLRDELEFDYPADLTAWDTGEKISVWLRLWNMVGKKGATVQTDLERFSPTIASLVNVWAGVNWHERECFDLYGIRFEGHPDMDDRSQMRILLPEDWEGHPFRKDYVPVFAGDPLHGPQETN